MKTQVIYLLYAFGLCLSLISCQSERNPVLAPENIFDNRHLSVITSIINPKKGTIAIVYGNDLALKTASDPRTEHADGEVFEMVTWELKAMPKWYGTDMNGDMLSVETVKISKSSPGKLLYDYHYTSTKNDHNQHNRRCDDHAAAAFIVSTKAAIYPNGNKSISIKQQSGFSFAERKNLSFILAYRMACLL